MNSINIIGLLKETIDEQHRYFEYDIPYPEVEEGSHPKIVTRYWTRMPNARLVLLPVNTRVAIHGHLDVEEKFGTILHVELLEVIK